MATRSQRIRRGSKTAIWPWLFIALLAGWPSCSEAQQFSRRFDNDIERSVKHYWADLPMWKLWKAQLVAESGLDPNVCSASKACGLAQFLPATYEQIAQDIGHAGASRFDARISIEAGAYYDARLRDQWRGRNRATLDAHDWALCSYNRGLGNCLADQKECGNALLWIDAKPCSERHTVETVNYITRIHRLWQQLETVP